MLPSKKTSRRGIPDGWIQIGEGGNARVWKDGTQAIKRLKEGASKEAISRFQREAEIMLKLNNQSGLRIVPLHEIREREGSLEIVMECMDGSLEQAISAFAGNPQLAAAALVPIAGTLATMAARTAPIYHRDLKPSNLLYRKSPDRLYLADFGCAYLAEDERLTPAMRAMGAWAYRPPEYSMGRLPDVTEKGDVFSLGKVLWAMINGESGVVFPGPIWFEPEYDLGRLYPSQPRVHHAMLAISQAVAIRPERRPSMMQLFRIFNGFSAENTPANESDTTLEILRAQSDIEVEYEQRKAATAAFVRALHNDFHKTISDLATSRPDVLIWSDWYRESKRTSQTSEELVRQVAEQESDAPIVVSRFRRIVLNTRFYTPTPETPLRFSIRIGSELGMAQSSLLEVTNRQDGIWCEWQIGGGESSENIYQPSLLTDFLVKSTQYTLGIEIK